jgi:hypothetical protein
LSTLVRWLSLTDPEALPDPPLESYRLMQPALSSATRATTIASIVFL